MRRIAALIAVISVLLVRSPIGADADNDMLLIVELQTASQSSATQEFVELFNPSASEVDVSDWQLQYRSATGVDWSTKATLSGTISGRHRYLLATAHIESSQEIKSGFSGSGGHVRIARADQETVDLIGWGTAAGPEGVAAIAPAAGESLKRVIDEDGAFVDTDDNAIDYTISTTPTPQFDPIPVEDEVKATEDEPESSLAPPKTGAARNELHDLMITELFIDPEKPLTDAEDEFVEIHNPTQQPIVVTDYIITTGIGGKYSFTLPQLTLKPGEYKPLFSIDTGLTLSNSGGAATVLSPDETILFDTEEYSKAVSGESWSYVRGEWVWALPSPGKAASVQSEAGAELEDRSERIVQNSTSASEQSVAEESRDIYEDPETYSSDAINSAVLAGVGALAVLYAGYEYRHDIRNRINQLREYARNRRESRAKT